MSLNSRDNPFELNLSENLLEFAAVLSRSQISHVHSISAMTAEMVRLASAAPIFCNNSVPFYEESLHDEGLTTSSSSSTSLCTFHMRKSVINASESDQLLVFDQVVHMVEI